jgi:hypothetical protein
MLGDNGVGALVPGAVDAEDALRLNGKGKNVLNRPVVVDWNNGKVVLGGDEGKIKALVDGLK